MIIIYAHYSKTGHCGAALEAVETELQRMGRHYEVWDLYQTDFNPIFNPETRDAADDDRLSKDGLVRAWQEKILLEEEYIFIYPTWWVNVPAILKGFYDRVFTSHFAFRYRDNGFPEGLLKGRRAFVITTTGGPEFYHLLLKGLRSLKVTTRDTLNFCGIQTSVLLIGSCVSFDEAKSAQVKKRVAQHLATWMR